VESCVTTGLATGNRMTERKNGLTYADAGVDIDAGNRWST